MRSRLTIPSTWKPPSAAWRLLPLKWLLRSPNVPRPIYRTSFANGSGASRCPMRGCYGEPMMRWRESSVRQSLRTFGVRARMHPRGQVLCMTSKSGLPDGTQPKVTSGSAGAVGIVQRLRALPGKVSPRPGAGAAAPDPTASLPHPCEAPRASWSPSSAVTMDKGRPSAASTHLRTRPVGSADGKLGPCRSPTAGVAPERHLGRPRAGFWLNRGLL